MSLPLRVILTKEAKSDLSVSVCYSSVRAGVSHFKVVLSIIVAFIWVPLKIHLTLPKPISIKFLPVTVTWVKPVCGPQGGFMLVIIGVS